MKHPKLYTCVKSGSRYRYCIRIELNGKQRTIGWVDTEEDAIRLAEAARYLCDTKARLTKGNNS
jgi:hypothetical protein